MFKNHLTFLLMRTSPEHPSHKGSPTFLSKSEEETQEAPDTDSQFLINGYEMPSMLENHQHL
jgi:hypothetical protein